jgi:hypothetical protein
MLQDAQEHRLSGAAKETITAYDDAIHAFLLVHGDAIGQPRRQPARPDILLDHGGARRHTGHIVGGSHRSAIDPGTDASSPVTGDAGSYRICLWPVRAASVIMSSIRCRVTAVSKPGCIELPFRIASPNFA